MVGAGIFALFGEAGAIAGAAVWVSFLVGGIIALLQGYSFSKLGARYPSAGGIIDWIVRGYGSGLFTGGIVMLGYFSYIIVTAMVAVSFGNYATELLLGADAAAIWPKIFAAGIVILLTFVNSIGAETVSKAQTAIVSVVLVILSGFAVAMLMQMNPSMLAPSTYPPMSYILASVALTFFAYLGFGVIAFTGGDLENPKKNMPRAMYISLGFTLLLYVALAIGVFGTLTVEEVIANADTALAAALPIFGMFGYTLISIAAMFATTGAINSQLYATIGATYAMAKDGHLPPVFGRKRRWRPGGTQGLVISSLLIYRPGPALRRQRHRLDRQRGGAGHLRFDHDRPSADGQGDRGFQGNARPGADHHGRGHPGVRLVHPEDRAANLRHPGGDDRPGLGGRGDLAEHQQAAGEERGSVKSELGPATRQLFASDGLIPNPMAPLRTTQ